jgi:hypothetical protein
MVNLSPYHSLYSLLLLILISASASNSLAAECSATKLCPSGCCSQYGFCGFVEEHCGDGCLSTCDAEKPIQEVERGSAVQVFLAKKDVALNMAVAALAKSFAPRRKVA